jgi:hypothetical protein
VRELNKREDQNILKLKLNEIVKLKSFPVKDMGEIILSKALNSLSSRSAFFTVSITKKGFTNPFFKFLDSPNKSAKMP